MASVCFGLLLVDDGMELQWNSARNSASANHITCQISRSRKNKVQRQDLNNSIGTEGKYIVYPRIYAKKWYTTKHKCNKITKRRNRNTRAANVKQNRGNKKEHASVRWRSVEHLLLPREGGKKQSLLQEFVQTSTYPNFSPTLIRWPFSMFQFHPP